MQNKVICVQLEVKFMVFHYFLQLVHTVLILKVQCCKTLCIHGEAASRKWETWICFSTVSPAPC